MPFLLSFLFAFLEAVFSLSFLNILSLCVICFGLFKKYAKITGQQLFLFLLAFIFIFVCFFQFYFSDVEFVYFYASIKQLFPFFILPLIFSFYKRADLNKVIWFLFYLVFISAYLEALTPYSYLEMLYSLVFPGGIPDSYYFREGAFMKYRLGGIFFSPLTLGGFLAIMVGLLLRKKFYFLSSLTFLLIILTGVKSAILIALGLLFCHFFKKIGLFLWAMSLLVLGGYLFNNVHSYFYVTTSISAHVLGLFYGLKSISLNSFFGHGVGTSGYNFFLEFHRSEGYSLSDPFLYGGESFFGILCYQLGVFGGLSLILLWGYFLIKYFRLRKYDNVSLVLGFLFFSFFSESVSTYLILFMFYYFLMFDYEN